MRSLAIVFTAVLLAAGCSQAPLPITAGDLCFNCRRPINDVRLAGEVITRNNQALKFRSPACMARFLTANPDTAAVTYVTDFATGRMIRATSASFVPYVIVENYRKTPDYIAYLNTGLAKEAAVEHDSTPIGWKQVLERAAAD